MVGDEAKVQHEQPGSGVEALFEAANRDPALKRRLLANPRGVAEEWKASLSAEDEAQLVKLGVIAELADEVRFGRLYRKPGPIFRAVLGPASNATSRPCAGGRG